MSSDTDSDRPELSEGHCSGRADVEQPDRTARREAIRRRAERIRSEELQRAIDRLDARDALTDEHVRVLTELSRRLVDGVLPEQAVTDADGDGSEAVLALFEADA